MNDVVMFSVAFGVAINLSTISFMLKGELHLGPSEATYFFGAYGIAYIPFCIKMFYGLVIDIFPIGGARAMPYIVISMIGSLVAITGGSVADSEGLLLFWQLWWNLWSAVTLTAVEQLATAYSIDQELSESETNQRMSSLWLYFSLGMLSGSVFAFLPMGKMPTRAIFGSGVVPGCVVLGYTVTRDTLVEPTREDERSCREICADFSDTLTTSLWGADAIKMLLLNFAWFIIPPVGFTMKGPCFNQ